MKRTVAWAVLFIIGFLGAVVKGGPYTEKGICSYIGPDHKATTPWDPNGVINPIFRGWATVVVSYDPAPGVKVDFSNPAMALGPKFIVIHLRTAKILTMNMVSYDTVSLANLFPADINAGMLPGQITLSFT